MSRNAYDDLRATLEAGELTGLTWVPTAVFESALAQGRGHPFFDVVQGVSDRLSSLAAETNRCFQCVERWSRTPDAAPFRGWLDRKIRHIGSHPQNASGALAELRAFGTMLSTYDAITHRSILPVPTGISRSPDFALGSQADNTYVEVCCLRHNDDEDERQRKLDQVEAELEVHSRDAARLAVKENPGKAARATASDTLSTTGERVDVSSTAVPLPTGEVLTSSVVVREHHPEGPDKGGPVHTIASRIAGKKAAGQIPAGAAGVLWMDCCDSSWPLSMRATEPVFIDWKGMNLATTQGFGIHSMVGRTKRRRWNERSWASHLATRSGVRHDNNSMAASGKQMAPAGLSPYSSARMD